MNITLATKDDFAELDKFVRYPGVLVGENLENFDYLSIAFAQGHFIYKCSVDDEVIGLMVLNTANRHIEVFAIDESRRGTGLWADMFNYMIANHSQARLYGETANKTEPMARILEKYGFTNVPVLGSDRQGWWLR